MEPTYLDPEEGKRKRSIYLHVITKYSTIPFPNSVLSLDQIVQPCHKRILWQVCL